MNDIKYKKEFGQNFIYDTNLLKAIVNDAGITQNDEVLEIGVGIGSLTKELCLASKKVVSVEIDTSLKNKIEEYLEGVNNSELIFNDILKLSNEEIGDFFEDKFKIVANLPYYITTPIIFKFLNGNFNLESMTIMVQKEVGERICAKENCKDYGILSVSTQSFADCKIVRNINRKMFTPSPNVDSCLVKIDLNKGKFKIKDKEKYIDFVKKAFSMRRKTLLNNLKDSYCKDNIINGLSKIGLSENARSEQVSVQNFVKLYNILNENL